ncbi:MAG: hypothetical protein M1835_003072, partial [Candelina submexicana]
QPPQAVIAQTHKRRRRAIAVVREDIFHVIVPKRVVIVLASAVVAEAVVRNATSVVRLAILRVIACKPGEALAVVAVEGTMTIRGTAAAEVVMVEHVEAKLATLAEGTDTCLETALKDRNATT